MKTTTAEKLGISQDILNEAIDGINPLRLAITKEFRDSNGKGGLYQNRAIELCIDKRISFDSETNSLGNLVEKVLDIKHPVTGEKMKFTRGGGNSESFTFRFKGEDGVEIALSLNHDAISVFFPEQK